MVEEKNSSALTENRISKYTIASILLIRGLSFYEGVSENQQWEVRSVVKGLLTLAKLGVISKLPPSDHLVAL